MSLCVLYGTFKIFNLEDFVLWTFKRYNANIIDIFY